MIARCGCKALVFSSAPLAAAAESRRRRRSSSNLLRSRPAAAPAGDSLLPFSSVVPSPASFSKHTNKSAKEASARKRKTKRREKITEPLISKLTNRGAAVARQDQILVFFFQGKISAAAFIYLGKRSLTLL